MPLPILPTLCDFLRPNCTDVLQLTFACLDVELVDRPEPRSKVTRRNCHLYFYATKNQDRVKLRIVDNLAFPFTLQFEKPQHYGHYTSTTLILPKPLQDGTLEINADSLVLHFTITAPNSKSLRVRHTYTQLKFAR
ncbi:hypothetical protein M3P19_15600 [Muricauda sp. 2012CJ35-5]|uniref:Uncharacterized protein n=1 Tax=Flagellimonas spongiicola TaxID=2942208 RepID=A0ABT0PVN5_9FLAO|nr:hypothetical protein [Allomuricauda spongiicola]MCL6275439.1 hypothetical protein [Allomuricauda spongiicola]